MDGDLIDPEDEGDVNLDLSSRSCLGSRIFQHFIDQSCLHVNSCQFEQLFTQDEMKEIILLISRSILTDDVRRRSSNPDEQMDRWMCLLGVCSYVLETLEVVNLARN